MRLRYAPLAVMATLLFCPAAVASEMQYTPESGPVDSGGGTYPPELRYVADPGETNHLVVTYDGGAYVFTDTGATVRPGPCTAVSASQVRCMGITPQFGDIGIRLGDGDDTATAVLPGPGLGVDGGEGNDTVDARAVTTASAVALGGGGGDDTLYGSDGGDLLYGDAGADVIRGGSGTDSLEGGDGSDTLDGGPGIDTLTYRGSTPRVVNLADPGPDGGPSENDSLRGIENVTVVGTGDDVLIGDDGPNVLYAGGGANRVDGRGGPDRINVGGRADVIAGGAGGDVIDANGKFVRRTKPTSCGAGSDLVRAPGATDLLERDCERVEYLYFLLSSRPVALDPHRGIAAFRWNVECPRGYRCSALLAVRSGRTLLGQAYLRVGHGTQRFHVRLTAAGRAFARAGRSSRVQVSVRRDRRRNTGGRVGRGETRTYGIRGLAP